MWFLLCVAECIIFPFLPCSDRCFAPCPSFSSRTPSSVPRVLGGAVLMVPFPISCRCLLLLVSLPLSLSLSCSRTHSLPCWFHFSLLVCFSCMCGRVWAVKTFAHPSAMAAAVAAALSKTGILLRVLLHFPAVSLACLLLLSLLLCSRTLALLHAAVRGGTCCASERQSQREGPHHHLLDLAVLLFPSLCAVPGNVTLAHAHRR